MHAVINSILVNFLQLLEAIRQIKLLTFYQLAKKLQGFVSYRHITALLLCQKERLFVKKTEKNTKFKQNLPLILYALFKLTLDQFLH